MLLPELSRPAANRRDPRRPPLPPRRRRDASRSRCAACEAIGGFELVVRRIQVGSLPRRYCRDSRRYSEAAETDARRERVPVPPRCQRRPRWAIDLSESKPSTLRWRASTRPRLERAICSSSRNGSPSQIGTWLRSRDGSIQNCVAPEPGSSASGRRPGLLPEYLEAVWNSASVPPKAHRGCKLHQWPDTLECCEAHQTAASRPSTRSSVVGFNRSWAFGALPRRIRDDATAGAAQLKRCATPCWRQPLLVKFPASRLAHGPRSWRVSDSRRLVDKLWSYCNVLRDDGVGDDRVHRAADLPAVPEDGARAGDPAAQAGADRPDECSWQRLLDADGDELEIDVPAHPRAARPPAGHARRRSSARRRTGSRIRPSSSGSSST